jgi:hypothetical protein
MISVNPELGWGREPTLSRDGQGPLFGKGSEGICQDIGSQLGAPGLGATLLLLLLADPRVQWPSAGEGKGRHNLRGRCPGRESPEPAWRISSSATELLDQGQPEGGPHGPAQEQSGRPWAEGTLGTLGIQER